MQPLKRILVIDDAEDVRVLVQRQLVHLGYEAHGAGNGVEGLESIAAHLPDLVGSEVEAFARGNAALKICAGMADMHEPDTHTPNEEAARILFVDLSREGATVVLAYTRPGSEQGRCDALITAENCVDAWRRFLKKHAIVAT